MASSQLNVIALISGGKDSFYSILHCIQNGHRIVALANLFPDDEEAGSQPTVQVFDHGSRAGPDSSPQAGHVSGTDEEPKTDLNSFMYQTVGHGVIPLYAAATGLPLYRRAISGRAVRHERDYDYSSSTSSGVDETESMLPLLQAVVERHPESNAVCAGAILSTYQRTRVESIALRLGLTPLAYLWKYPVLPGCVGDDARLLKDMAAAGLEARIIKVASAGLGEDFLWETATSFEGAERVKRALRKFGASSGGAVLGEGGEFETLVVDGPRQLFAKKSIMVPPERRRVVQEGGGSSWLEVQGAKLQDKNETGGDYTSPRIPELLDANFRGILEDVTTAPAVESTEQSFPQSSCVLLGKSPKAITVENEPIQWAVIAKQDATSTSVESETVQIVSSIRQLLAAKSLDSSQISNTVIVLRRMSDFVQINAEYGKLFTKPNPPSRVTVSCGNLLPAGSNIAIYVTVDPTPLQAADRQALHVQSQSYWAPANIGPYSQAVGIPITSRGKNIGPRTWSIAGQIPLIPSSMHLPAPSDTSHTIQTVLSLQHLWRIGRDMRIQFWTSVAAFFARTSDDGDEMRHNAKLATRAWQLAHGLPDDDDDAEDGLDPWDLKFNSQHMSLTGGNDATTVQATALPDWSTLTLRHQNEPETAIPPFFAVEVEELPRQSTVEWHAHLGLSQLEPSSVEVIHCFDISVPLWRGWHVIARGAGAAFIHTVLARNADELSTLESTEHLLRELSAAHQGSQSSLCLSHAECKNEQPYLTYVDPTFVKNPWNEVDGSDTSMPFPVVPCRSVWTSTGTRIGFVAFYRKIVEI
jgi:diphthine-ammonia ligase